MLYSFAVVILLSLFATGAELPNVAKYPWYKTYNGYSYKSADMAIATSGEFLIFPFVDEKRISKSHIIKVNVILEYKAKGSGSWVTRKPKEFRVSEGAKAPREKAEVTTVVTGDVAYIFRVEHDKKGVSISAEFVELPDYSEAKYRLSIVSEIPDLYGIATDARKSDVSAKVRGDGITLTPVFDREVRKKKFKLNGEIDLSPYAEAGVKSVRLDANRYGDNKINWILLDESKGTLNVELKNPHRGGHKGFLVSTILVDQTGELRSKGLRIEVK